MKKIQTNKFKHKKQPSPALRASSPQGARLKLVIIPIIVLYIRKTTNGNSPLALWGEGVRRTVEGPFSTVYAHKYLTYINFTVIFAK